MKERVKINIKNRDGQEQEATVLLYFKLTEYNKEYVIYTYGEKDENDLQIVYTSSLSYDKDGINFETIETDEEWMKIKEIMKSVIRSNREG